MSPPIRAQRRTPLPACEARRLIAQAHAEDVARATAFLNQALESAGDQWVPVDAIADALLATLPGVAARCLSPQHLALRLEALAGDLRGCAATFDA